MTTKQLTKYNTGQVRPLSPEELAYYGNQPETARIASGTPDIVKDYGDLWNSALGRKKRRPAELSQNWQNVSNTMRGGGTSQELLQNLIDNFQGADRDLSQFMESPMFRTIMAFSGKNTPEYKKLQGLQDPTAQQMNIGLGIRNQ